MDNPLVTPEIGMLFWTAVVFLILMFLLTKFAWKPILSAVKERDASIEEALSSAKEAKLAMAELKSNNEDLLNEARSERDAMLKEARSIKDTIVSDAKTTANEEADKIIVMDNGGIIESGTHNELLQSKGLYYRMQDQET